MCPTCPTCKTPGGGKFGMVIKDYFHLECANGCGHTILQTENEGGCVDDPRIEYVPKPLEEQAWYQRVMKGREKPCVSSANSAGRTPPKATVIRFVPSARESFRRNGRHGKPLTNATWNGYRKKHG